MSGCMGLLCRFFYFSFFIDPIGRDKGFPQPRVRRRRGGAQIADDLPFPFAVQAVLPGIAVAARRAASFAAVHPAAAMAVDRRRAARRAGPGSCAAAWGVGEDVGLSGAVRLRLHVFASPGFPLCEAAKPASISEAE